MGVPDEARPGCGRSVMSQMPRPYGRAGLPYRPGRHLQDPQAPRTAHRLAAAAAGPLRRRGIRPVHRPLRIRRRPVRRSRQPRAQPLPTASASKATSLKPCGGHAIDLKATVNPERRSGKQAPPTAAPLRPGFHRLMDNCVREGASDRGLPGTRPRRPGFQRPGCRNRGRGYPVVDAVSWLMLPIRCCVWIWMQSRGLIPEAAGTGRACP